MCHLTASRAPQQIHVNTAVVDAATSVVKQLIRLVIIIISSSWVPALLLVGVAVSLLPFPASIGVLPVVHGVGINFCLAHRSHLPCLNLLPHELSIPSSALIVVCSMLITHLHGSK